MSNNSITRVHYFEHQFLRTEDFTEEQAYHLAMQRRHNIAHHTWGIVRGLELANDKDGNLSVRPGVATDGYGRYLILAEQKPISTKPFDDRKQDVLDVWLEYARQGSDTPLKGYSDCAGDQVEAFYRWQEEPIIRLETPPDLADTVDQRTPQGVPEGDLIFDPSRTPPDDPQTRWPVFLGQVTRARSGPKQPYTYKVKLAGRPYAGLVGTQVSTPTGQARVQLEAETADDPQGFVVFLTDPMTDEVQPRLQIEPQGPITAFGDLTLYGDLTLNGGFVGLGASQVADMDKVSYPSSIYHIKALSDPDKADPSKTDQTKTDPAEELRIELPHANADQGRAEVVIGAWSAKEKTFKPCLTVADDRTVTVHGNLIVEGFINNTQADLLAPPLSDAARGFLVASYSAAASSGATQRLEQAYKGPTGIDLEALGKLLDTDDGRQQVLDVIVNNPGRCKAFIQGLLANATALADVIDDLIANHLDLIISNSEWRDAFIARLLANTAALTKIIEDLVANHARPVADALTAHAVQTVVEALLTNQTALKVALNDLLANSNGRSIAVSDLLATEQGQQAVVDVLLANLEQLQAFLTKLLKNKEGRKAVATKLLTMADGRQSLVDQLVANAEHFGDFLTKLLKSATGRKAVAENLLTTEAGRQAAVNALIATQEGRLAVASGLLGAVDGRQVALDTFIAHPDWATAFISLALGTEAAQRSLAGSLESNPTQLLAFATLIKTDFSSLATTLIEALSPSP